VLGRELPAALGFVVELDAVPAPWHRCRAPGGWPPDAGALGYRLDPAAASPRRRAARTACFLALGWPSRGQGRGLRITEDYDQRPANWLRDAR